MPRQNNLRESLISAFEKLASERPLSSITVGDLCREVGISRNAFYTYFDSKESVLKAIMHQDFVDYPERLFPLFGEDDGEVSALLLMKKSYENVINRGAFYTGLEARNKAQDYASAMGNAMKESFLFTMEQRGCRVTPEREYILEFLTAGQIAIILRWIRSGFHETAEEMARYYISWTGTAMKALYDDRTFLEIAGE